jgi:UDP-N-acetylmuramoylalanine--D-glutamate ligase
MTTYCVMGLARSGVAAANALVKRGHRVVASDLRDEDQLTAFLSQLDPRVEVVLGENRVLPDAVIVVSPGIKPSAPVFEEATRRGSDVVGEIGLFYELSGGVPVLAVTGTDGKSTTTRWLGAMCEAAGHPTWVGGNLGTPLCASLDELTADHTVVAEVSCFQLSTAPNFHPTVAVITNIAPDHLDYYGGSFDAYVQAKAAIIANHGSGDTVVLNADDPILSQWTAPEGAQVLWFSRQSVLPSPQSGLWVENDTIWYRGPDGEAHTVVPCNALRIPGQHNVENAMAAAGAGLAHGLPMEAVQDALRSFGGLEHRIEYITTIDGVRYYNDSKATNPHASEAALRSFDDKMVLICGGSEKDSDFAAWGDLVAQRCHHVVCCGDTGEGIRTALGDRVETSFTYRLDDATRLAKTVANGMGVVVLSPACASFDQFTNFEERGRAFKDYVNALQ